jgi:hypothetical protein
LIDARSGRPCGKLDCNIKLTQVENASVELMDCAVTILDQEAHVNLQDYYTVSFNVTTFTDVHESTKSEAKHLEHTKLKAITKEALTTHEEKKIIKWDFSS